MKKVAIGFCLIACIFVIASCDLGLDSFPSGDDIETFYYEDWMYTRNAVDTVDPNNSNNAELEFSATLSNGTVIETVEKYSLGFSQQNTVTIKNTLNTLIIDGRNIYFNNSSYEDVASLPIEGQNLYSLRSPTFNTSMRWNESKTYKYTAYTISQTFTVINGQLNASLKFSGSYPYKIEVSGNIIGSNYVITGVKLNGKTWDDTQIDYYGYVLNNIMNYNGFLHLE